MPSRRELIQLTPAEISAYMVERKTLIIISNGSDGYPHAMPMWFYADDAGCLYCSTFRKSQKVLNFRHDPKATLLVESGEQYAELKSVLVYATVEIIDEFDAVCDALVKINTKGTEVDATQVEALTRTVSKTAEKRVILKFHPERYVSWDHSKLGGRY